MTQLTTKPTAFFKADPNQPRKHFDEAALHALGESLRVRQNDPVQSQPDGTIIDGERRLRAAMLVGLEELDVIITDTKLSDSQISMIRLTSFFHREDLTAYEKWSACKQILELNPVWTAKELAGHLHIDPSMVTRLLSPSKCTPAWQQALKDGRVGISDVYAASKLAEPNQQAELLAMRFSGASRDAIETAGRKKRAADVPAVKVNRVKCLLPSGVQIVVSGTSVSLDESIEALAEAIKEMKRARDLASSFRSLSVRRESHSLRSASHPNDGSFFSRVSAPNSALRSGSVMPFSSAIRSMSAVRRENRFSTSAGIPLISKSSRFRSTPKPRSWSLFASRTRNPA